MLRLVLACMKFIFSIWDWMEICVGQGIEERVARFFMGLGVTASSVSIHEHLGESI